MTADERWAEFGDQLRQLREAAGLSGKRLAESVAWQQSKVSRIENGKQAPSDDDLKTWCDACKVPPEDAAALREDLRSIRLDAARWKSRLRRGHQTTQRAFGNVEQNADRIRAFENAIVPGLLQTPDYARAVFTGLASLRGTMPDADEAVGARMHRQAILYDTTKQIELLVGEAALEITGAVSPEIMLGQLDRLLAVSSLHTLRFGILPFHAQLLTTPLHGFWIIDQTLNIEMIHTEITTSEPDDVHFYDGLLDQMWDQAAEGDDARVILNRHAAEFRELV